MDPLLGCETLKSQLARWLERLQELDFEVVHRKGTAHRNADSLSRLPCQQYGRSNHDTATTAEVAVLALQLPPAQAPTNPTRRPDTSPHPSGQGEWYQTWS